MQKRILSVLAMAALVAACSESTGPNGGTPQLSLSFVAGGGAPAPSPGMFMSAASDTLSDGQNTLVIESVEIVLREIELEKISDDACDSDAIDHDSCEKFETGPILLTLPLDGQVQQLVAIEPDTGTYDEVEFEIHKVTNDQEDAVFRSANPHMADQSIRVAGTFNGQAFVYLTDLDVEQEFDLPEPVTVDETTGSINVTVLVDVSQWFVDGTGRYVNPETGNKGGSNESLVKENIKQSIEAFEDDDRDGDDDHS